MFKCGKGGKLFKSLINKIATFSFLKGLPPFYYCFQILLILNDCLIFTDIKKCSEGYLFKCKDQKSNFLVPKKQENFFRIVNQYVERVNQDLSPGPGPNDEIFYTGRKFPDGTSRFIKAYLGIREIRGVPKHVAERLKLETPENYTSMYL